MYINIGIKFDCAICAFKAGTVERAPQNRVSSPSWRLLANHETNLEIFVRLGIDLPLILKC